MSKPKFTPDTFYKFFQCPHWLWYDVYAQREQRKEIPPLIQMIYEGGLKHKKEAIKSRKFEEINPESFKDLEEAFLATLELMRQGKNIYHGVLMDQDWAGIPDLLETRVGKSDLGDYHYVVYDIRPTTELRDEYKFQLVFYSLILERLQGVLPQEAYIVDADGNERSFLVEDFLDRFHLTRQQIEKILDGEKPPPFLKSGCRRTPWYSLCLSETEGCQDVSLIYRLSQMDQRRLYEIGIKTVRQLAEVNIDDLRHLLEDWPYDKLLRYQLQAQSLISQKPVILKKSEFPQVEKEIYFDIESDPTQNIDYLLGMLIKNGDGTNVYKYFFANDKSEESKIWNEFIEFLADLNSFVIYHYATYERQVFDRLVQRYGAPYEIIEKFRNNTVDLHRFITEAAIMPLYFYSLKDVAKYLDFKWRSVDAGGAESVVWYNEWLEKGDKKLLDKIIDYNEDDVRATLFVKEWLEKQKPTKEKEILPEK